jgi:hypothetical protein
MALRRRSEVWCGGELAPGVQAVTVKARDLLVLTADQVRNLNGEQMAVDLPGAIVWIEPPAEMPDAEVQRVVADVKRVGAARVVVLPRESADRDLPSDEVQQAAEAFRAAPAMVRDVAAELLAAARVDEAVRKRAEQIVDEYLTGAGL